ncbi:MAG: B-box zinc finger protein [Candidatus Hodarchaeota archaeon]
MSIEVLRTETSAYYKIYGYFFIIFSPILLIYQIYTLFKPVIFETTLNQAQIHTFIFIVLSIFFMWLGIQCFGSYLIVYSDGIKVRKSILTLKYEFISWNLIKEINFYSEGRSGGIDDPFEHYAIYIFLKDRPYSIIFSDTLVDKAYSVYNSLLKYIKPIEIPDFCQNHPKIKSKLQCRNCGAYVCEGCIEEKKISGIHCECSLCIFKKGLNRIKKIHIILLINTPLTLLIFIINLYEKFFTDVTIFGLFFIPYIITFSSVIILTPYAFGTYLANINRQIYLKQLDLKYSNELITVLLFSTIPLLILNFFWVLFSFIKILNIIQLFTLYLVYTIIITLISYWYERPRKVSKH